ncbi:MAG: MFS transporter [Chitinophagaceae bacterium]|nr:MFS transporter [Chitinophagaceae bacterium]
MEKRGTYRWTIVALLFVATTINYLDRQVIGLLKDNLSEEFGWSEIDYGNIVMAFSAAYAIGLLVFGRIIDGLGTRTGYAVSIVIWSVAAMAHAVATTTGGFMIARTSLGFGEGGNFPAAIKAVAEWFPRKERAFATGIFNSGTNVAAMMGPPLIAWIYSSYGWKEAFLWTGALGFIWLIFWFIFFEVPARQKRVGKAEFDYIHSDAPEQVSEEGIKIGWGKILGFRQTWSFVFGKMLTDPVWWFYLFWIPSFFNTTYGLDLKSSAIHISTVYVVSSFGSIFGGYLSGFFIKKGWPVYKARKITMLIFAFCVVPIVFVQYISNIWVAVALISLGAAAHQAWSANIYTTASDMFPKKAVSSVIGVGGMGGSIGGILFPFFVGWLLDMYEKAGNKIAGYNIIFIICGCAYLVAWLVMHFLTPKMKQVTTS